MRCTFRAEAITLHFNLFYSNGLRRNVYQQRTNWITESDVDPTTQ